MPIDPSISLRGATPTQVDFGSAIEKGLRLKSLAMQPALIEQQIASSKASQAHTEASTPGAEAHSALLKYEADGKKWLMANSSKFMKTDSKGLVTRNSKGVPDYDFHSLVSEAAKAGFPQLAQTIGASALDHDAKQVKNADDALKVGSQYAQSLANINAALPVEQRAQHWEQVTGNLKNQYPNIFTDVVLPSNPGMVHAIRQGTMSPLEQEDLGMRKAEQTKRFSDDFYQPGSTDTSSPVAQVRQTQYGEANPNLDPSTVKKLSPYDVKRLEQGAGTIAHNEAGSRVGAETRFAAHATATDLVNAQTALNRAEQGLQKLLTGANGVTLVGEKVNMALQKYVKVHPEIKMLQDAVQRYEQITGRKIDDSISLKGVGPVLKQMAAELTPKIKEAHKKSSTNRLGGGSIEDAAVGAGDGGTVRMRSPSGVEGTVPAHRVEDALAKGYKRL
jgi:hypothetical protein